MKITIDNLLWQSDLKGYEVGFHDLPVVGLYHSLELHCNFYISYEDSKVLMIISLEEE